MARIRIDNATYEVRDGLNLLEASLELGFDLPYFCWHPALGSVGACRQCAVKQFKNDQDKRGKLVMSCLTPASEGVHISIEDRDAHEFRKSVIEWLMTNHPHDCPVCDEGGECHLQDMTHMTGHDYRRYRFTKRTFRNQNLGPFVNHEMNRCITCYRCVRFYRDYAGGRDFDAFAAHDHVYFGRHEDGVLENEFSGNLVEVCPTGVFTDKTLKKHYTRKWDLQTAPSVCPHCSLGCNIIPGERYGSLRRIRNRYHPEINGYFLCDRGRYGYEYVNGDQRIREVWSREGGTIEDLARALREPGALDRTIGIGSPRASLEANFALRRLVGEEHFFSGFSGSEDRLIRLALRILKESPARSPSLREIESADVVLVLGEDVPNTAPRMALSIRQAVRNVPLAALAKLKIPAWNDSAAREAIQDAHGPLFVVTPMLTRLEDVARVSFTAAPDDLARLGFAIAALLDESAPKPQGLDEETQKRAREISEALKFSSNPVVITGTGSGSAAVLEAAANIAWALVRRGKSTGLSIVLPEANSLGVGILGGKALEDAFGLAKSASIDTAIILENDLYRRAPDGTVDVFLKSLKKVILIEQIATAVLPRASWIFPAASFAEGDGTLISQEGRAQRFYRVMAPRAPLQESWRWIRDLGRQIGGLESGAWETLDDVLVEIAATFPELKAVREAAPPETFRIHGARVARQPHRYSGRTSMHANESVHEPKPPEDPDSSLAFSMEGYFGEPPAALIPRFWAPEWNSVQALNKFQSEIGGALRSGSPGVRLIEGAAGTEPGYFSRIPESFRKERGSLLAVPIHHVFGSDETSALSAAVAERVPRPYVALNPKDAEALGLIAGDALSLEFVRAPRTVSLRIDSGVPEGTIGVPAGIPGLRLVDPSLPYVVKITAASRLVISKGAA